jgi:hypothetical protein
MTAAAVNTTVTEALLFVGIAVVAMHFTGRVAWVRILAGPLLAAGAAAALMAVTRDTCRSHSHRRRARGYIAVLGAFEWFAFPDDAQAVTKFLHRATADA